MVDITCPEMIDYPISWRCEVFPGVSPVNGAVCHGSGRTVAANHPANVIVDPHHILNLTNTSTYPAGSFSEVLTGVV